MAFKLDSDTAEVLSKFNASYRIDHITPKRRANGTIVQPATIRAELVDLQTGQVILTAEGSTELAAVQQAVAKLEPEHKRRSPAELAAENEALRARLAAHEGEQQPEPQGGTDAPPEPPSEAAGDGADDGGGTWHELTGPELAKAIEAAGLPVPAGARNTRAWREKAIATLESARDETATAG